MGAPIGALVGALLAAARITLSPGIDVTSDAEAPELVAELKAGLEALPEALRQPPGGPLSFHLRAEPSAWGLGDGSSERPEFSPDGSTFYLYAFLEADEPRAQLRLEKLTSPERRRLWWRRAVIHAVLHRWDEALKLSREGRWRRAGDWLSPGDRIGILNPQPYNSYAWSFSRARGQTSPEEDLATFAEELFASPEHLRDDALPADDRVACQEFTRIRALDALLREHRLGSLPLRPSCPGFERWARPGQLAQLEVLFVNATDRVESLFGHMMLRPVFKPSEEAVEAPGFGTVVQLTAWTDSAQSSLAYVFRGLTGGFNTIVSASPSYLSLEPVLTQEQRSVRRFRLTLSEPESQRVLERVWELERRGYFRYFFFSDNCATVLLRLINTALDDAHQVRVYNPAFVAPAAVLDGLARIELAGRRLLEPVGAPLLSTADHAVLAEARRTRTVAALGNAFPAAESARLLQLHDLTRSTQAQRREAAWRDMTPVLQRGLLASEAANAQLALEYLVDSVAVEKALLDQLELKRRDAAPPAPKSDKAVDLKTMVEQRQRAFQRETHPPNEEPPELPAAAPRDALTPEDRRAFEAATDALGVIADGPAREVDAVELFRRREAERTTQEETSARRGIPRSGWTRLAVAGGVTRLPSGGWAAQVGIRTALLLEQFGEPLQHAYSPRSEISLLSVELQATSGEGRTWLSGESVTLFRYRMLYDALPQSGGLFAPGVGWGAGLGYERAEHLGLDARFALGGELLFSSAVDAAPSERFFLLSLGGELQVRPEEDGVKLALAPRVSLLHRVALSDERFNAVEGKLEWAPAFVLGGEIHHELKASLSLSLLLPRLLGIRWLVKPEVKVGFDVTPDETLAPGASAVLNLEPL
jgi:hypothetical protein